MCRQKGVIVSCSSTSPPTSMAGPILQSEFLLSSNLQRRISKLSHASRSQLDLQALLWVFDEYTPSGDFRIPICVADNLLRGLQNYFCFRISKEITTLLFKPQAWLSLEYFFAKDFPFWTNLLDYSPVDQLQSTKQNLQDSRLIWSFRFNLQISLRKIDLPRA